MAGTDVITYNDSDIPWGYVALSGWQAQFQDLKVGYDPNGDDVIEDVVINDAFDGTSVSPTYDDNGNMTKNANFVYTYDAWNNLVKVVAQNVNSVVVAEYAYFGDNRRAKSVITSRGDLDATTYYSYDGFRVIQDWDGTEGAAPTLTAYVYGPNYIDEPVLSLGAHGAYFVYQDANANVIGLTTPAGDLAEEYNYTPYGRMVAKRHHAFGDGDADGDVDDTDNTAWEATQPADAVYDRNFDSNYDGNNDKFDFDAFNANYLAAGTSIEVSGRAWSPNGNPYTYTARRLDAATMLMHYRLRTYSSALKSFLQRDPFGYLDSSNLYQYVGSRPLRYVDPSGQGALGIFFGAVGAYIGYALAGVTSPVWVPVAGVAIFGVSVYYLFSSIWDIWPIGNGIVDRIRPGVGQRNKGIDDYSKHMDGMLGGSGMIICNFWDKGAVWSGLGDPP